MTDSSVPRLSFDVENLGVLPYAEAFALQRRVRDEVVAGGRERLLVVEHPPVITMPDRPQAQAHILASPERLDREGVEVQITDRGGDVTYHGPGQLVVYPILRLRDHGLNLGKYMRLLEAVVIDTLDAFGIRGHRREGATGVWVEREGQGVAKICALGVRIGRNVTMHGLALNITTNLGHFDLIVPCGLAQRDVTSMEQLLGDQTPSREAVVTCMMRVFAERLSEAAREA